MRIRKVGKSTTNYSTKFVVEQWNKITFPERIAKPLHWCLCRLSFTLLLILYWRIIYNTGAIKHISYGQKSRAGRRARCWVWRWCWLAGWRQGWRGRGGATGGATAGSAPTASGLHQARIGRHIHTTPWTGTVFLKSIYLPGACNRVSICSPVFIAT